MKPKCRILSLLLAICFVIGLMPTAAFAADGDKTIMDILLEETDPEYFNFIPDVYWIQVGGENPAEFLKRLKGRVKVCHFKDGEISDSCPMITAVFRSPSVSTRFWCASSSARSRFRSVIHFIAFLLYLVAAH